MTDREKLVELASTIIDASLFWTGQDEEKSPKLKRARTLAGLILFENETSLLLEMKQDEEQTPVESLPKQDIR